MSLLKQLLLSVSVAIVGILLGTLALSIDAARSYLTQQLQSQSENAASSLSLSLSQPGNQDPVTQELLMAALFDTGQFAAIGLRAPDGRVLFERQSPALQSQGRAPAWFRHMLPLPQPQAERAISDGWRQVGNLSVMVDNRFAMDALWSSSIRMTGLILVAGGAWALFVGLLLRWFRRVLHEEIEAQVLRIGTSQSDVADVGESRVAELTSVSHAIQHTHVRVQQAAQAQTQRIEHLELETNSDPVTQLPNRKYFVNELQKLLLSGPQAQGHVLMVRQRDLQAMNTSYARHEVDEWLKSVWQQVQQLLADNAQVQAQLARLNGSDFVVLLPGGLGPEGMHMVQQLRKLLQSQNLALGAGQWTRWAFALTAFIGTDTVGDVLSRLDRGLMQAESAGHGDVEYAEATRQPGHMVAGERNWQQLLSMALQTPQALQIAVQPQTSTSLVGTDVRHEASLELHEPDGRVLGGAFFLPAAVRLGMSADYDLQALSLGLQWLGQHPGETLVVRVSVPSLEQDDLVPQVRKLLQSPPAQALGAGLEQLVLELDAHALEVNPARVAELCDETALAHVGVGLRRLDQSPKALWHLPSLPLRYVKLGGYFAEQSLSNPGVRHLLEAMISTAQDQGVRVYITDAVAPEAAAWLRIKGASLPVQGLG
ncbi:bifunctional diguanylate cyclase/phosphodiesterase [Comamonas aquatica]|uniref:bifunctional diguanylate cyclase/phosphodiesterase n=1 Tax=Comamonas aquatica TaxID=225991 RepID=UPI0005AA16ED|nr:LapD/MoxY N-terminal periplasmic domain-containing protein [Comamonas aquatica]